MGGVFDDIEFREVAGRRAPSDSHDHAIRAGDPDAIVAHLVGACARCTMLDARRVDAEMDRILAAQ